MRQRALLLAKRRTFGFLPLLGARTVGGSGSSFPVAVSSPTELPIAVATAKSVRAVGLPCPRSSSAKTLTVIPAVAAASS